MSRVADLKNLGKFIAFEGCEGAGKTTQINLLAKALEVKGLDFVLTREPGGTPGAEKIRSLLVEGDISRWQPMTEALLHYSARLEHVNSIIIPALKRGTWVISDRFSDSTLAYQGYGLGLGTSDIKMLHKLVLGDFQTDLTIILDVPNDIGVARAKKREENEVIAEDRYERMDLDFHQKVKDGFLDIARLNSARCVVIDADRSMEDVNFEIIELIKSRFYKVLK